jgi:hypothetical protein
MSLPPNIRREHIQGVLRKIDRGKLQIPKNRAIRKYEIRDREKKYPPKFVISQAGEYIHRIVPPSEFGGGTEANNFLIRRGFEIWNARTNKRVDVEAIPEDDAKSFPEGRKKFVSHVTRERNPRIAKAAKNKRLHECGELLCDVCGFSFRKKYGDVGDGFIEAHHTIPVSQLRPGAITKLADIALVCSNCHRMLHRKRPWIEMAKLKTLLRAST